MQVPDMAVLMVDDHLREGIEILLRYVYVAAEAEGGGLGGIGHLELKAVAVDRSRP